MARILAQDCHAGGVLADFLQRYGFLEGLTILIYAGLWCRRQWITRDRDQRVIKVGS
ncbi:hypothetical protein [Mitsuaria sp. 7]|uniref:hypothetical protein n=1 Tax=Mitsuaria sp. 7 TaxID=1658665 RepID=UPI0012F7B39F|nr:hypothetical protein [Mitsuaria sp. 7]